MKITNPENFVPFFLHIPHSKPSFCYPINDNPSPIEDDGDVYSDGDHDMRESLLFESIDDAVIYYDKAVDARIHNGMSSRKAIKRFFEYCEVIEEY